MYGPDSSSRSFAFHHYIEQHACLLEINYVLKIGLADLHWESQRLFSLCSLTIKSFYGVGPVLPLLFNVNDNIPPLQGCCED